MRFHRPLRKHRVTAKVDLTPLIGVLLLLLLFFLVTATFEAPAVVPVMVSRQEAAEGEATPHISQTLTITLQTGEGGPDNQGPIYLNETPVGRWEDLAALLAKITAQEKMAPVLLRPDARVPTGRTMQVMGYLNNAGIRQYNVEAQARRDAP